VSQRHAAYTDYSVRLCKSSCSGIEIKGLRKKMTTYGRNAKNVELKSKIDELDMLINSFQYSDEKDMVVELENLREQLSKMLDGLE
jgi:hypothetical protein